MTSLWLRKAFARGYDIDVGEYSYGCFDRERFAPNMKIGRYCSFSRTCRRVNANHGLSFLSLHPYFYNSRLGFVHHEKIIRSRCEVSDDVWVGHNVIILPNVTFIGRGAVLAAGSVITKNVPSYSVMAGVPARVISKRFDDATIEKIEASRWWELSPDDLKWVVQNHWDWISSPETLPDGHLAGQIRQEIKQ